MIDYAGIFPPAALDISDAAPQYFAHASSAESWILGRFICPGTALDSLLPLLGEKQLELSLLASDLDRLREHAALKDSRLTLRALELKHGTTDEALGELCDSALRFREGLPQGDLVSCYVEAIFPTTLVPKARLALTQRVLDYLAERNRAHGGYAPFALKFRCGWAAGVEVPSSAELAATIQACRENGVALKFTGGLHHPFRTTAEGGEKQHGFLTLFAASALFHNSRITLAELEDLLVCTDPAALLFTDEALEWRSAKVTTAEIQRSRCDFVRSFGSCSFSEPVEYLTKLRLI